MLCWRFLGWRRRRLRSGHRSGPLQMLCRSAAGRYGNWRRLGVRLWRRPLYRSAGHWLLGLAGLLMVVRRLLLDRSLWPRSGVRSVDLLWRRRPRLQLLGLRLAGMVVVMLRGVMVRRGRLHR